METLITVMGGVAHLFGGNATIIDFDEWEATDDEARQDMIESVQAAGYRCIVYGADGERPNIFILKPDEPYDQFINDNVHDDESFVVYDPNGSDNGAD